MKWLALQEQLIDLGFEEDEIKTDNEYGRIIRNAVNHATRIIRSVVVPRIEGVLIGSWGSYVEDADGNKKWEYPTFKAVTSTTDDNFEIRIPDICECLIPLLSAHYIWLDDDIEKAVTYWNEYDLLKEELIRAQSTPRHSVIEGGF